ncbi:hypothetical protein CTRI78_v003590 [Colletotrichum trifolii]|uniref:Transcription factor domain-containing protein n=1 Tax=Colletotrichum trifolii TaxID=5466 RepID=A0A4R8RMR1_COLTR|nr:hypothetical protein CTRI78_v003590 [Colletotrichum trifolii]
MSVCAEQVATTSTTQLAGVQTAPRHQPPSTNESSLETPAFYLDNSLSSADLHPGDSGLVDMEELSFGPEWNMGTMDLSSLQAQFDVLGADCVYDIADDESQKRREYEAVKPAASDPDVASRDSWEPENEQNHEVERQNLAVEETLQVPPMPINTRSSPYEPSLSSIARNSIIGMILKTTSEAKSAEILGFFPGLQTLNSLLAFYSQYWERATIDNFVHLPTLHLDSSKPELLASMIAIGALQTQSTVARKFGYALQEVVRTSTFRTWEEKNSNSRDISLTQGFLIQQRVAFFSGIQRKVTFAEACYKCLEILIKNGVPPEKHSRIFGVSGPLESLNDDSSTRPT